MPFKDTILKDFEIELSMKKEWVEMKDTHFHNCYEFYYLAQGEITYFVENNIYNVKKGDIILIPPYTIHKTRPYNDPKHKRILIYFTSDFVKDFLNYNDNLLDSFNRAFLSIPRQKQNRIENILEQLLNEYNTINKLDIVMIKSLLGELLVMLNRHVQSDNFASLAPLCDATSNKILEVVRFINENYSTDISLESLGKEFFINTTYLSRTFKKVTGFSFVEYLTKLRMKHAVELLIYSDLNITSIALKIGFNSSNHFCKMFRDIMGISPLKYRKMY